MVIAANAANSRVNLPFTRFRYIERVLRELSHERSFRKKELAERCEISASVLTGALTFMKSLDLISTSGYKRGIVELSHDGEALAHALEKGDYELLSNVAKRIVQRAPQLSHAMSILSSNPRVSTYDLGRELADFAGRRWGTASSYRNVGRGMIDILAGLRVVPESIGSARKTRGYARPRTDGVRPSASIERLLQFLDGLDEDEFSPIFPTGIGESAEFRVLSLFKSLVDLKLVESRDGRLFRLTHTGSRVTKALRVKDEEELARALQQAILRHRPSLCAIERLANLDSSVGWREVGLVLEDVNNTRWKPSTAKTMGTLFLSWLKAAGIALPNHQYGMYRVVLNASSRQEASAAVTETRGRPSSLASEGERQDERNDRSPEESLRDVIVSISRVYHTKGDDWRENTHLKNSLNTSLKALTASVDEEHPILSSLAHHIAELIDRGYANGDKGYLEAALVFAHRLENDYSTGVSI